MEKNPDITNPLCNKDPGITNDNLQPNNSNMYGKFNGLGRAIAEKSRSLRSSASFQLQYGRAIFLLYS